MSVPLPPLPAFRLPINLRDLLVWASLTVTSQEPPGNCPCWAAGCKMCQILMAIDEFTSHTTGQVFKIHFAASCKPSNIIYLTICRRCGQQYVGETGQLLHCRINGHRYNITHRNKEESHVALHFNVEGHTLADMTVAAIDIMHSHDSCLLKIWESRCIRTMGTSYPLGTNIRVDSLWNLLEDHHWKHRGSAVPLIEQGSKRNILSHK